MFILSLSFEFYSQGNRVRERINASPKVTWISDGRDKEGFLMLQSMCLIITLLCLLGGHSELDYPGVRSGDGHFNNSTV